MGNTWQKVKKSHENKNVQILFVGLHDAGKTSTLYRMKLGEVVETFPTMDTNFETISYKDTNFSAWDIGGRGSERPLYQFYTQNADVVLFVIDSTNRERISECRDEIWRILSELKSSILLVMANKQDLPNAMSVQEVTEQLELNNIKNRPWHIQGTCVTTGEGLHKGLDWLQSTLTQKEVKKAVAKPLKEVYKSVLPDTKPSNKPKTSSWLSMITSHFTKTATVS